MHFKNGREAKVGDHVVTKNYDGNVVTGVIHNLRASASCNCDVSLLVPGGVVQLTCQTVGNMYHAADALLAVEPTPAAG